MELRITEPERWQLAWELRTPLLPLLVGIGAGWLLALLILLRAPTAQRWPLLALLTVGMGGAAAYLALALPREESGLAEFPPDGEATLLHRRRFLRREQRWQAEGGLHALRLERASFAESGGRTLTMARLWAEMAEEAPHPLTPYLPATEAERLAEALAHRLGVALEVS